MAFQVTCLILVLGITFMQSIFGFFSGLLNLMCTIVAVCVGLGYYEALSAFVTKSMSLSPSYAEPVCLILLFLLTLSALRFASDNLIRGNVQVPSWLDWTGASICGFINAQLIVGIVAISVLMLPIGGRVMMFERYSRTEETDHVTAKFERNSLWTRPDEMTVGFFNTLSNGSLRTDRAFASVYPSFVDNVFYSTNTVQPESTVAPYRDKKGDGFEKGITLEKWWEPKGEIDVRFRKKAPDEKDRQPQMTGERYKPQAGNKLIAMRLQLDPSSGDRRGNVAWHLFRPTMLRVVGTVNGQPRDYVAKIIGGADELTGGKNRLADLDTNFSLDGNSKVPIDVYFEVDESFRPEFVEYRRHARTPVTGEPSKDIPAPLALVDRAAAAAAAAMAPTFGRSLEPETSESIRLPFAVAAGKIRGREGVEIADGKLVKGRFQGSRTNFDPVGDEAAVRDFQVPSGMRLVQVRWQPRKVRTLVGQVFSFVDQLNQFSVTDNTGEIYWAVGYYGNVRRPDGREDVELFFNGPPDAQMDPAYKSMLDFKFLKRQDLQEQENATLALWFFVKPGVRIVSLKSGNESQEVSIPVSN